MKYLCFFFLIILSVSCKKDNVEVYNAELLKDYMPIQLGQSNWIYQVKEIRFNSFTKSIDSSYYQVWESFDTFFIDKLDRSVARFYKYERSNDSANWVFDKSIYKVVSKDYLEVVENNTRYIKLSFPASVDAIWDENERNNNGQSLLYYASIFKPFESLYFSAQKTLEVESDEIKNSFEERFLKAVYGKGIGLMYTKQVDNKIRQGFFDGFDRTTQLLKVY